MFIEKQETLMNDFLNIKDIPVRFNIRFVNFENVWNSFSRKCICFSSFAGKVVEF